MTYSSYLVQLGLHEYDESITRGPIPSKEKAVHLDVVQQGSQRLLPSAHVSFLVPRKPKKSTDNWRMTALTVTLPTPAVFHGMPARPMHVHQLSICKLLRRVSGSGQDATRCARQHIAPNPPPIAGGQKRKWTWPPATGR